MGQGHKAPAFFERINMITVKNRVMAIPKMEKYIGTVNDANAESRLFRIDRYTDTQSDMSGLTFKLITTDETGRDNIINLTKAVSATRIDLTWTIIGSDVTTSGTLLTMIKGFDAQGAVRWNSFIGAFYISENLEDPTVDTSKLSDYEAIATRISTLETSANSKMISNMTLGTDGYLTVTFGDSSTKRFLVKGPKGDPPTKEEIIEAAQSIGTDIQALITQANTATATATAAAATATAAAEDARAAARGDKIYETVTFTSTDWGSDGTQEPQNTTLAGKTGDFVTSLVIPDSSTADQVKQLKKNMALIDKMEITSTGVKAKCFGNKPTVNLSVYFREV